MGKLDEKKLLVLGSNLGSVEMVSYAKSEGAYVIVTDYLPDDRSPAKAFADRTEMISTLDVDALCTFAEKEKIDGVFCGISEMNLRVVRQLATRLELPCYFTETQWELTESKDHFKKLCKEHGVPQTKEFFVDDASIDDVEYPVIVKPVDRSSGIGIHVCRTKEELISGLEDARKQSISHQALVEEYLTGDEFIAVYQAKHGSICLSAFGNMITNREQVGCSPISEGALYPACFLARYKEEVNDRIIELFKSIGFRDGYFFVQGIANEDRIAVFECGLRLAGGMIFKFNAAAGQTYALENLIDYALLGEAYEGSAGMDDPEYGGKRCCIFNILNRGGTVGSVEGIERFRNRPEVINITEAYHVGDTVEASGTLRQLHYRFHLMADNGEQLSALVQEIRDTVRIMDTDGNSMMMETIEPERVRTYWE